jgi:hypothetical protein
LPVFGKDHQHSAASRQSSVEKKSLLVFPVCAAIMNFGRAVLPEKSLLVFQSRI